MLSGPNGMSVRLFVATWNVGGKPPHSGLNLDDFLQVHDPSDIYVLGFQEIVPLNAGNVLVTEDSGPAATWLTLISQSLNKVSSGFKGSSRLFGKTSLRAARKSYMAEYVKRVKSCNCNPDWETKNRQESCFRFQPSSVSSDDEDNIFSDEDDMTATEFASAGKQMKYCLLVGKQMVGIFLTVWIRAQLIRHISHLRTSLVSRGIMGCLGNKGCISVSMSFHRTSFCFICSHLTSGEKDGDEVRRNFDVIEILKNTHFPKICGAVHCRAPVTIEQHDRAIWLGDLNYRIALGRSEARKLMEKNDWKTLLNKDQLKLEKEAGRVFKGWEEGRIYFAPTYKYSFNSDLYEVETTNSKNKRRSPAWCDRILWHGTGIRQLSYVRRESRFSDHRPVCAIFLVDVGHFSR